MMPPCLSCHSSTRRKNSSRPRSWRVLFSVLPQIFLHGGLGSDSGMIHPRQPKDFESLHPRAPRENVLDRIVQHMAERQHARDVRRRHHDRERRLRRIRICYEIAILQPSLIPFRFNGIRIVPLGKFSHRDQSSESGARLQMGRDAVLRCPGGGARPLYHASLAANA